MVYRREVCEAYFVTCEERGIGSGSRAIKYLVDVVVAILPVYGRCASTHNCMELRVARMRKVMCGGRRWWLRARRQRKAVRPLDSESPPLMAHKRLSTSALLPFTLGHAQKPFFSFLHWHSFATWNKPLVSRSKGFH